MTEDDEQRLRDAASQESKEQLAEFQRTRFLLIVLSAMLVVAAGLIVGKVVSLGPFVSAPLPTATATATSTVEPFPTMTPLPPPPTAIPTPLAPTPTAGLLGTPAPLGIASPTPATGLIAVPSPTSLATVNVVDTPTPGGAVPTATSLRP